MGKHSITEYDLVKIRLPHGGKATGFIPALQ
jgi:hypothetical protein